MNADEAKAAILAATRTILDLNKRVGNPLPDGIPTCVSSAASESAGSVVASAMAPLSSGFSPAMRGGARKSHRVRRARRYTRRQK